MDSKSFSWVKPFDESRDVVAGPRWLFVSFVFVASSTASAMVFALYFSLVSSRDSLAYWWLALASFSVTTGLAWYLGMRGRVKNGLLLTVLLAAALYTVY
jgi:hypothetical protein